MMRRLVALLVAVVLGAGSAAAETPIPVVVGWGKSPDVPQLAEAVDKHLWGEQNLAPQLVPFVTGRDAFEALVGGQLDLAIMAEFPAVVGAMRNAKFAVPAVLSAVTSIRVITKGPAGAKTVKELAGAKIGVPIGTNVHFLLAEALKQAGVAAELVNVGPTDLLPSLLRGDISAAMAFPSSYQGMKHALGADYREIPLPGAAQFFILVASEKVATGNPDLIRRFLAALLQGEKLVAKDPKEAQEADARYVAPAMSLDAIRASWPDYTFRIALDKPVLELMVKEGQWLHDAGFVKDGTPSPELFSGYFLAGPLKALAPDRVTIP